MLHLIFLKGLNKSHFKNIGEYIDWGASCTEEETRDITRTIRKGREDMAGFGT